VWKTRVPPPGRDVATKVSARQFDWRFELEASVTTAPQSHQINQRFGEFYAEPLRNAV